VNKRTIPAFRHLSNAKIATDKCPCRKLTRTNVRTENPRGQMSASGARGTNVQAEQRRGSCRWPSLRGQMSVGNGRRSAPLACPFPLDGRRRRVPRTNVPPSLWFAGCVSADQVSSRELKIATNGDRQGLFLPIGTLTDPPDRRARIGQAHDRLPTRKRPLMRRVWQAYDDRRDTEQAISRHALPRERSEPTTARRRGDRRQPRVSQ
jgi:hypothetical protein